MGSIIKAVYVWTYLMVSIAYEFPTLQPPLFGQVWGNVGPISDFLTTATNTLQEVLPKPLFDVLKKAGNSLQDKFLNSLTTAADRGIDNMVKKVDGMLGNPVEEKATLAGNFVSPPKVDKNKKKKEKEEEEEEEKEDEGEKEKKGGCCSSFGSGR